MPASYVRRATVEDVPAVIEIINGAKKFLKDQGIDQWQGKYPDEEVIKSDIYAKNSYVLIYDGQVAGTASLVNGIDDNYTNIKGEWKNGSLNSYSVIHRFAVSGKFRGKSLSRIMMSSLISIAVILNYDDIRVDTHPENKIMQHVITSNGFNKAGDIKINEDGKKVTRYAYQLTL